MKKLFYILVLSSFLLTCIISTANANLVVNGSFEDDPFTANGNYELGLVGNDVTGWYIPNSNGIYPWGLQDGAYGAYTPFGNQWIVLGLWSSGFEYSIQQTLTGLDIGSTYNLSFAIASEDGGNSEAEVSFLEGSLTAPQVFSAPTSGQYWTDWGTESLNFVASSSTVTFQFKNINVSADNGYDLGLDNVSVEKVSVPEPTTLLLIGFGLIGLAGFGRKFRKS